jgi:hypothetical protein
MTCGTGGRLGVAALPAALIALTVSAALGAAVADLARIEVVLARHRRVAAALLAQADACVASVVADLRPGWDFAQLVLGPDGTGGTADDGAVRTPPGCTALAHAAPGPPAPPRVEITVAGVAGARLRSADVVVGRAPVPGPGALLWLAAPVVPGSVRGSLGLEGEDAAGPAADWAGIAAPQDPAALDAWVQAEMPHVSASPRTLPPVTSWPPPLADLATRVRAASTAGAEALVASGTPPFAVAWVPGDLVVTAPLSGAGCLFVEGALDIRGRLDFTGLVVASGGVAVVSGAELAVNGALWIGAPVPGPALSIEGTVTLRQSRPSIDAVDRLVPLPRRAVVLGLRDLG